MRLGDDHLVPARHWLISIRAEYWKLIRSGAKTCELRRGRCSIRRGDVLWVYASRDTKAIVGSLVVGDVTTSSSRDICKRFSSGAGVGWNQCAEYFRGATSASCISIACVAILKSVVALPPSLRPPQRYYRLENTPGLLRSLQKRPTTYTGPFAA